MTNLFRKPEKLIKEAFYLVPESLYNPKWLSMIQFFNSKLIDRSGTIRDFGFNYKILKPLKIQYTNKSLKEVALERAKEINDSYNKDKRLTLLWSGGIDSTLVFYCLNEIGADFDIIYTNDSIIEYPELYSDIKRGLYGKSKRLIKSYKDCLFDNGRLFITGELGDQSIGSALFEPYIKYLYQPYDIILKDHMHLLDDVFKVCPHKITNLYEGLWWINFCLKYQPVQFRMSYRGLNPLENTYHFFDSYEFNYWSISNIMEQPKIEKLSDYKYTYKKLIYEFNKDEEYLKNKVKLPSLIHADF